MNWRLPSQIWAFLHSFHVKIPQLGRVCSLNLILHCLVVRVLFVSYKLPIKLPFLSLIHLLLSYHGWLLLSEEVKKEDYCYWTQVKVCKAFLSFFDSRTIHKEKKKQKKKKINAKRLYYQEHSLWEWFLWCDVFFNIHIFFR